MLIYREIICISVCFLGLQITILAVGHKQFMERMNHHHDNEHQTSSIKMGKVGALSLDFSNMNFKSVLIV